MATEEVTWAMRLGTWVAVWHILVGLYLWGLPERASIVLRLIALVKFALGVMIYLLVRRPAWAVRAELYDMGLLVPIAVGLLLLVSVIMTWLIWQAYELDPPWTRCREILATILAGPVDDEADTDD